MDILIINGQEVRELLSMAACIDAVEDAFTALAHQQAVNPLRPVLHLPDGSGVFVLMPAILDSPGMGSSLGIKAITVKPGNHGTIYDSHQGAVLLFEAEYGRLLAVIDASEVTAIRTAAASAWATRLLANEDAGDLAILGSGVQARSHLAAMQEVRAIRRVRVWSRSPANARRFAEREGARHGLTIEATPTAEAAVASADLVCTTTASPEPVLMGEWITPGTHLNVVGASLPTAREVDTAAIVQSRLFVDRRESALNEAGDILIPIQEGAITAAHIQGELADLALGQAGRLTPGEITLFKSLGLGLEDVAAAVIIYREAVALGRGTAVPFGGERGIG